MKRPSANGSPGTSPPAKRCAVYTRKSTDKGLEQDFNSLDAQREACVQYVRNQAALGWQVISESYDDGGFTGANLERPAFQRLSDDIEAGKIDIVVVYKVDRLSRSLLDFARVMDRFNRAGCAFVSVTQNFSTADAMGRLTLNMLMSFAEFEREMISERTRDKIAASRRRGKWTGGHPPLGYDVVEHRLVVNKAEAKLVQRVFDTYLEKRSALAAASALNAAGETTKRHVSGGGQSHGGQAWDRDSVLRLLANPIVTGCMRSGGKVFEGEHEAIIAREQFERVQAIIASQRRGGERTGARNPDYLLSGLLRCVRCGHAFTPASTRRGSTTYRYYRCVTRDKQGRDACPSAPLPAKALEEFVLQRIREALAKGGLADDVAMAARARVEGERRSLVVERAALPAKIAALSAEGQRLVETGSDLTGTARRLLAGKLQEIGDQLAQAETRLTTVQQRLALLNDFEIEVSWVAACLRDFNDVWELLTPQSRARLVRAVVSHVEIDEPANEIRAFLVNLNASEPHPLSGEDPVT